MTLIDNDLESHYRKFRNSARSAFGPYWEGDLESEKLPEIFRNCIQEMVSAMKRATRIANIVSAKDSVEIKQKELEEAKRKLANFESTDLRNTESAKR